MRKQRNNGHKKTGFFVDARILDLNMKTVFKVKHVKLENALEDFRKILEKYR